MSGLQQLRVLQEDMGSDAVTLEDLEEGVTWVFVSPYQSFDSAIRSVMKVCPDLSILEVQDLVRSSCPDIKEMNARLGIDHPPVPRFEAAPEDAALPPLPEKGAHRRPRPPRWVRIAAVAAPALVGGTLLAQLLTPAGRSDHTGNSQALSVSQADAPSVFDDPAFKQYVKGGKISCESVGQYAAKCVDTDGQVMLSEASVGDSAVFTFSYSHEKIGFRVFDSTSAAQAWAKEDGNQELYEHLTVVGRVALWGTDASRLQSWADSLTAQAAGKASPMGGAAPLAASSVTSSSVTSSSASAFSVLPRRLAVLAFGTLGVTGSPVTGPAAPGSIVQVQTMRAVALVMGTAEPGSTTGPASGPGDAVAIAADAPRPPKGATWNWLPDGTVSPTPLPDETVPTTAAPAPVQTQPSNPAPAEPTAPTSTEPEQPSPTEPTAAPAPTDDSTSTTQPAPTGEASEPAPAEQPTEETKPADASPAPAESSPEDTQPSSPAPAEPAAPAPAPAEPTTPAPAEPTTPAAETPQAPAQQPTPADGQGAEQAPETTPAPPVQEEPEDGLSMGTLPTAWAA